MMNVQRQWNRVLSIRRRWVSLHRSSSARCTVLMAAYLEQLKKRIAGVTNDVFTI